MEDKTANISQIAISLIKEHKIPTPFLFLDEAKMSKSLGLFRKYLPEVELLYAVKANSSPSVVSFFIQNGLSLDVASVGEIKLADSLNLSGEKLFLSTPVKTLETIKAMFDYKVASFAVDTVSELHKVVGFQKANNISHSPSVFIRIRVDSKNVEVDLNTKFGCSIAEAIEIISTSVESGLKIGGICFHVGSQSTSSDNYFLGIESAILIAKEASRRFGVVIPTINIGGGFCDESAAVNAALDLEKFYKSIGDACNIAISAGFRVFAEPGRCLVSSAGTAVASVIGVSERAGQKWAYLDDGIYGCFSIKLYENHAFNFSLANTLREVANHNKSAIGKCWTIAGPTCDSLDVIAERVDLPFPLNTGDVLVVPNMGAYSISTASNFNGFTLPKCLVVSCMIVNGKLRTVISKDSTQDNVSIAANL